MEGRLSDRQTKLLKQPVQTKGKKERSGVEGEKEREWRLSKHLETNTFSEYQSQDLSWKETVSKFGQI